MTFWFDLMCAAIVGGGVVGFAVMLWLIAKAPEQPQWQVDEELERFDRVMER